MQFSKRAPGTIHKKFVRTESAKKIRMRVIRANLNEAAASFNEGRATNALVGADVANNFNAGASAAAILVGGASTDTAATAGTLSTAAPAMTS